jgi:hypothetical protein
MPGSRQRSLPWSCLPSKLHRWALSCLFLLFALPSLAIAQLPTARVPEQKPPATTSSADDPPDFSLVAPSGSAEAPRLSARLHGLNAEITLSGVHESTTGWATLFTPAIAYTFNHIFSVDATLPVYTYRLAESLSKHPKPNAQLVIQHGEPGDIIFGLHAQFVPARFLYQATAAFTAPTGDQVYGLTTGRVTFDINNHFERSFGRFTPNLELGGGDSTTLVNRVLNKNYTSLGPLAHAQVGLGVELFHRASFETDTYEQLPIGDQKTYGPSRHGHALVVTGHNAIEDNGFINVLDIPFDRHTTLSSYYSRSLRLRSDTVAIGITYLLRGAPPAEEISIDDLFR